MAVSDYIKKYQAAGNLSQSATLPPLSLPHTPVSTPAPSASQPVDITQFAGQKISASRPPLSSRLINLLPEKARPIAESLFGSVHDALFGNVKDKAAGITPQPGPENNPLLSIATLGVLGRPKSEGYFSSLGKTPTEQVQQNAKALEQKGVAPDRAASLALYEVFSRPGALPGSKEAQVAIDAKQKYQALQPNAQESRTLSMARFFQGLGSAGDVAGVLPVGSLAREGGAIPKALEGLAQEAGKYKTAQEFEQAMLQPAHDFYKDSGQPKSFIEWQARNRLNLPKDFDFKDFYTKATSQAADAAAKTAAGTSESGMTWASQRSEPVSVALRKADEDLSKISANNLPSTLESLKISPSSSKNLTPKDLSDIKRVYSNIEGKASAFVDTLKQHGIEPDAVSIKKPSEALAKIARKRAIKPYTAANVGDVVRGNIVVNSEEEVQSTLSKLGSVATNPIDNFAKPNAWGYRGLNTNIKLPDGTLSELQIHTPASLKVQEAIHPIYSKYRNVEETQIPTSAFEDSQAIADRIFSEASGAGKGTGVVGKVAKGAAGAGDNLPRERGFITSAKEVIPEADKIAGQYIPRETDQLAIKAKNLIKDDVSAAEHLALSGTSDESVAAASELLKHYAKTAAATTDKAIKNAMYDKAAEIANTLAPKLTELGRSIQAASILGRLTPEGQVRFAAKEILKWNAEHPNAKVPNLTGPQADKILNDMLAVTRMKDGEAKAIAFQKVQDEIRKLIPSTWIDKVITVWKAGLLTGLKTTGVNFFANLSHAATEIAKDIPAAATDTLLSLVTGKRTVVATTGGFSKGMNEGIGRGWQYFKTGYDSREVAKAFDGMRVNFKSKAMQGYVDTVFRALGAADQPFYYGALKHSLYSQAAAVAKNKGVTGAAKEALIKDLVENPTHQMATYSLADAEQAVFLNRTELGKIGSKLQQTKIGQFVLPFARTPSAVAMQIINYSPVGGFVEIGKQLVRGKFDQRLLSQAVGRSVTGLGVLWTGSQLFKNNMVSLDYPTSEKERELWKAEGRVANSIKIDGKWRSVQALGPAGPILLLGAHYEHALKDTGSPTAAMITAFASNWKSFTEQTFLRGVNDTISAITDPARNAATVTASFVSSVIPTILNDVARATDPKERLTAARTLTQTVLNRVESRIPGLREGLQPQVDVLGNERAAAGNPLEIMADPTRPSPATATPVTKELRRLMDAGFNASPSLLGDKAGFKALTPEQNTKLWEYVGKITNDKLTSLFSKESYQSLPDDNDKANAVESVVKQAQVNARAAEVLKLTQGLEGSELTAELSRLKAGGLMTQEVFRKWQTLR